MNLFKKTTYTLVISVCIMFTLPIHATANSADIVSENQKQICELETKISNTANELQLLNDNIEILEQGSKESKSKYKNIIEGFENQKTDVLEAQRQLELEYNSLIAIEKNSTVYIPPTDDIGGDYNGIWPLQDYNKDYITQKYGDGHNGIDIGTPFGTPIIATESGEILSASYHSSWGNNVFIYHNGTYSTRYAHMSSIAVSNKQHVEKGQIIGYVGNTGESFGDHLHFEIYKDATRIDPLPYFK